MAKYSLTPPKLQQNFSQLIQVGLNKPFNILKLTKVGPVEKWGFFSRWPPKWPPKPLNHHKFVTSHSNLMILVSIPSFGR